MKWMLWFCGGVVTVVMLGAVAVAMTDHTEYPVSPEVAYQREAQAVTDRFKLEDAKTACAKAVFDRETRPINHSLQWYDADVKEKCAGLSIHGKAIE
jgi:hypothetical protein